ncbi:hypothetical protein Daesc_007462 [Daldinia eschscholtzii]|uniref:AN1-type domain-containing protein n=1 Tax=Daldinia eschscholtzii TaxID=292717 RepID=A0AAX6MEM3_9PEZI
MAPQKPRCTFKECKSAAQRIVGDCGFCDGHFCAKHRLLEDHKCSGLEDVSMNPTTTPTTPIPSESSDSDDWATEWWLVGLGEYLEDSGLLEEGKQKQSGGSSGSCSRSGSGCKKESHERNAAQLEAERTQVIRGV